MLRRRAAINSSLRVLAPAKVNLALEVLRATPDGYHELDTVFCWLGLADELEISRADGYELLLKGEPDAVVPTGEDNLVTRAVRALEARAGRALPVRIELTKRLPAGGGVGGGSADAAAALWGLDRLYRLQLGVEGLLPLASRLGADVAFGLLGGAARGRGRGDRLEELPAPPALPVLLLVPGFPAPTPEVYRAWDRTRPRPAAGSSARVVEALESGFGLAQAVGNDLEPAAFGLWPELSRLKAAMLEAGCRAALLSGSGSSLFGLLAPGEDPNPVAEKLRGCGRVVPTCLSGLKRCQV